MFYKFIIFLAIFASAVSAQYIKTDLNLLGNLKEDSKILLENYDAQNYKAENLKISKKSPALAALMSLVVPGAGEIYTKNYYKAAAFILIEAAAIAANIHYNKVGDEKTIEFQNYANENWSVVRYAEWLNNFADDLSGVDAPTIYINPDETLPPWERVDFSQINAVEDLVPTFSHKLHPFGDQQYYELIGKYHQYNHGWADSNPNTSEYLNNISPMFSKYAQMHILPDEKYYKYATIAGTIIFVNHIFSALDAAWSASKYNKKISLSAEVKHLNMFGYVEIYPQLNIQFNF